LRSQSFNHHLAGIVEAPSHIKKAFARQESEEYDAAFSLGQRWLAIIRTEFSVP
jgi:hypothetical protein